MTTVTGCAMTRYKGCGASPVRADADIGLYTKWKGGGAALQRIAWQGRTAMSARQGKGFPSNYFIV